MQHRELILNCGLELAIPSSKYELNCTDVAENITDITEMTDSEQLIMGREKGRKKRSITKRNSQLGTQCGDRILYYFSIRIGHYHRVARVCLSARCCYMRMDVNRWKTKGNEHRPPSVSARQGDDGPALPRHRKESLRETQGISYTTHRGPWEQPY